MKMASLLSVSFGINFLFIKAVCSVREAQRLKGYHHREFHILKLFQFPEKKIQNDNSSLNKSKSTDQEIYQRD